MRTSRKRMPNKNIGAMKSKNKNERNDNEFNNNEIVLVTIPGFAPWPACILDRNLETYFVQFFGTGQM